jgi:hypothetical protein
VIPKESDALEEMTEDERACIRAHTSVDKSGNATIKHAVEGLGLDEAALLEIRRDAQEVIASLSAAP